MNCLLVMPKFNATAEAPYEFPLGFGYVSAAMKQCEALQTFNINLNHIAGDPLQELLARIKKYDIKAVLVGGMFRDWAAIRPVLEAVKHYKPEIRTLVGGMIITGDPETGMDVLQFVDYGIIGEGEISVPALCLALKNGDDPSKIDGLIFKEGDGYVKTPPRAEIKDLSTVPWCDYEGLEYDFLLDNVKLSPDWNAASLPRRSIAIMSVRGCPYNCTFCAHPASRCYRERSLDDFFAELEYLLERFRGEYVRVFDDMLGRSSERLEEFCRRIKQYKLTGWTSSFRADQLTPEKLEMIRDSGCKTFALGLESANNTVLRSMRKQTTIELLTSALQMARQADLKVGGNFIFGDPAETYETSLETINWWKTNQHLTQNVCLLPLWCFPGSQIYEQAVERGIIGDRAQFLRDGCPPINISKMSDAEYDDLVNRLLPMYSAERQKSFPVFDQLTIVEIDEPNQMMAVDCVCPACGQVSHFTHLDLARSYWLVCHHCETRGIIALPREHHLRPNPAIVRENLAALLETYSQVAFWGIGALFRSLFPPDLIDRPGVHLVDLKGAGAYGRLSISRPEAISQQGLKILIIPPAVSPAHDDILVQAREKYGLEKIITFFHLANEGLKGAPPTVIEDILARSS